MDYSYILNAYISRLTLADMENLTNHVRACTHAQLNQGDISQLKAQAGLYGAVCQAVENLTKHDKRLIADLIELETAQ